MERHAEADYDSSFLGPGSEGIIGAVFEAVPDSALEPDDFKATHLAVPSVDQEENSPSAAKPSPPVASTSVDRQATAASQSHPSSPLSRLFGKPKTATRRSTLATEAVPQDEVESLRAEMKEMRLCQSRMEDLLRQFVTGDKPAAGDE